MPNYRFLPRVEMTEGKPGFLIKDVGNDIFTFLEFRYRFYEYSLFNE